MTDATPTVDYVFMKYEEHLTLHAKVSSRRQADSMRRGIERHFGGGFDLARLTRPDLDGFKTELLRQGMKPGGVNGYLRVLRAAIGNAIEIELMERVPCKFKAVPNPRPDADPLTMPQVAQLLAAAPPVVELAMAIAAFAGLRHREILWLRWDDVQNGLVRVRAKDGWTPKSYEDRAVPLHPEIAARLARHHAPGRWLFEGLEGTPRRTIDYLVAPVFKRVGLYGAIRNPGLHALRRTWATSMLSNGCDLATLKKLGGWRNLATVERYVGTTDERMHQAISALPSLK